MVVSTASPSQFVAHRVADTMAQRTQIEDLLCTRAVLEANVFRVNQLVSRLVRVGLVNQDVIVGPQVLCRSYGGGSPDETEVVLAGLCTERGLVAIFWERDDLSAFETFDGDAMLWGANARAVPVTDCDLAIRLLVSRQAQRLLNDLCGSFNFFPSPSCEECICD